MHSEIEATRNYGAGNPEKQLAKFRESSSEESDVIWITIGVSDSAIASLHLWGQQDGGGTIDDCWVPDQRSDLTNSVECRTELAV